MSHNAYAFFFGAVLIGCLFALYKNVWRRRHEVVVALRCDVPTHLQVVARPGHIRVRPRRTAAFAPVKVNICRLSA